MLSRRWWLAVIVVAGVAIATIAAIGSVSLRQSTVERYVDSLDISGYRRTKLERRTQWAITTYWVGPAGFDIVKDFNGAKTQPLNRPSASVLLDGYDVKGEWQADVPGGPCDIEISRANTEFWQSGGRTIPSRLWNLSASETEKVRSGQFELVTVDVSC